MSHWTHIIACIYVDTYDMPKVGYEEIKEKILKEAPAITGWEGNANVFVTQPSGHTMYTNCDCDKCKYGDTMVHEHGYTYCDAEEGYVCPEGAYQTRIIITIVGDLRDKYKKETVEEYKSFKKWLKKNINCDIIQSTCRINE